jgi:hypothetical protein
MNFEQPTISQEKLELSRELIELAEKGINSANEAITIYKGIAETMVFNGMSDAERSAYVKILNTITELKRHKKELSKYQG